MSTVENLLLSLRENGVSFWLEGDQLRYRAPKQALTAAQLGEIRERKLEIIGLLEQVRHLKLDASQPLLPQARPKLLPLSFAQERLWFLDRLRPGGSEYNIFVSLGVEGALDVVALERSFGALIDRHEVLRTRIATVDGQGVQVIEPGGGCLLEVVDLARMEREEREAEARRLMAVEAGRPFDLEHGPLFRATLVRLEAQDHVMLVTMHHIVSDGWSIGVLCRELEVLYAAFLQGGASPLPALEVQYADYAVWQRAWLRGEVLERQLGYWRERLSGAPAALDLPTDRMRPAVPSFRGSRVPVVVSSGLLAALVELGRRRGATLYMVLLAAFQLLLSRWSGQRDVVVGSPIAGRTQRQTEGLIGFFANTLVLRMDFSGAPSFCELLDRVKETALGAYAHQDVPFERLVEELQPQRDLSRQPLFQVMFVLQNVPQVTLELAGLRLRLLERPPGTAKFDLLLTVVEREGALAGSIEYATDLFDRRTIERLADQFGTLLEGIVADPERAVSELSLLSEAERHRVVAEWNATASESTLDMSVHELFAAQAVRTPAAVAVAPLPTAGGDHENLRTFRHPR